MKIKRISVILAAAMLVLAFAGCSKSADIEKTIDLYMTGVCEYDSSAFESLLYFESEQEEQLYFWGLSDEEFEAYNALTDMSPKFTVFLREAASRITYSIESISENGDSAQAELSVTYVDGSNFAVTALERMYSSILGNKLDGIAYDIDEILYSTIYNMTFSEELDMVTDSITLELVKHNGEWKIVPSDALKTVSTSAFYKNASEIIDETNKYRKN